MSRSTKYHPYIKIAGKSDKNDKRRANRKFRRISRERICMDEIPPEHIREVSDTWSFSSDGLAMFLKRFLSLPYTDDEQDIKRWLRK